MDITLFLVLVRNRISNPFSVRSLFTKLKQEIIPVRWVPAVCQPGGDGGGEGPQVNKFEQVSNLGHQMSLAGGPFTVRSNASWVMIT